MSLDASETSTTSSITTGTSTSSLLTPTAASASSVLAGSAPTDSASASSSKSNAGAIAGGVVGGLGFVAIVGLGALWFYLRRKRNKPSPSVAFDSSALVSGTTMSHWQTNASTQGVSPFLSQPSLPSQPPQSLYVSRHT